MSLPISRSIGAITRTVELTAETTRDPDIHKGGSKIRKHPGPDCTKGLQNML